MQYKQVPQKKHGYCSLEAIKLVSDATTVRPPTNVDVMVKKLLSFTVCTKIKNRIYNQTQWLAELDINTNP
jgi:hypothetical protein